MLHIIFSIFILITLFLGSVGAAIALIVKKNKQFNNFVVIGAAIIIMIANVCAVNYLATPQEVEDTIYRVGNDYVLTKNNKKRILNNFLVVKNRHKNYYIPITDTYIIAEKEDLK